MFSPSCGRLGPFALTDLDMWETGAHCTAQTSTWCGMEAVSGSGFLSKATASSGGFKQREPGLRRWQSWSHLAPDGAPPSCFPASAAEWRTGQAGSRQTEVEQWLQDAHKRLDTQLDRLSTRDTLLGHNTNMFDIKLNRLSQATNVLKQDAAKFLQFERSEHFEELREKALKLENDLLQMKSTLNKGSNVLPNKLQTHSLLSRTSLENQEDFNKEKQKSNSGQWTLREALREAEARAKTHEEERNNALQLLQTSAETQRMMLNQLEEMNKQLKQQNPSEVQEQLREAKKKLSQAHTVNEMLRGELESIKHSVEKCQHQLHEQKQEIMIKSKQIHDLEAQRSQLMREKEELLSEMNQRGHVPTETQENCCQHRESVQALELEKQRLQDECLCFEAQTREKEDMLHMQEEEYQKQDAMRVQHIEELKAVVSHWTDKWQQVALSLQFTQHELEECKKNASVNKECDSLLRAELDACKQELENERSRSHALLQRYEDKGAERTVDRDMDTDASESSLICESPSGFLRNKTPQGGKGSPEVEGLRQKLADRDAEHCEKEEALRSLERLRQMEKTEAQMELSALELKPTKKTCEDCQDATDLQTDVSTTDSLRIQLDESRRRAEQLQQEKRPTVQKLPTPRLQLSPVKDEKTSVEGRKDQTLCAVNPDVEQQRRMLNEQLKCLFRKREGKETGKEADTPAAAQTESSLVPSQTGPSLVVMVNRRNWQQGSSLTPVFEEDEDDPDWTGEDDPAEDTLVKMSDMTSEICFLTAKTDNLLRALSCKQPMQHPDTAEGASEPSSHCEEEPLLWMSAPPLHPDGIFLAEIIDIRSPDEDEDGTFELFSV